MQPLKLISIWVSISLPIRRFFYEDNLILPNNKQSTYFFNVYALFFDQIVDGDNVPEVKTIVHGIISGVEMPFPLKNPDACVDSGLACPLGKDANYEYVQTLPVLKIYPKVSVHTQIKINNDL